MVLGRITVIPRHRGSVRVSTSAAEGQSSSELLVVNSEHDCPLVRYERVDANASLAVEIHDYNRIQLRSDAHGNAPRSSFEYRQPADGPVQLSVHDSGGTSEFSAKSLWHLLLGERLVCQRTIVPILEQLRPDWNLLAMTERIEAELLSGAMADRPTTRDEMERLVRELDATQFQRRQVADERLRSFGVVVLPHLDVLAERERAAGRGWSWEQRARIGKIRQRFAQGGDDTPDRVAYWLADDEQAWLALLKHPDAECRQLAVMRMRVLHPRGIQFDPHGDESYRQEQLAELRLRLRQP
jgi:hypothetical protein